jgi:hypothetical protein
MSILPVSLVALTVLSAQLILKDVRAESSTCYAGPALMSRNAQDNISGVRQRCEIGDVIVIPDGAAVATLCDFSKSIVSSDGYTNCVLAKPRPAR